MSPQVLTIIGLMITLPSCTPEFGVSPDDDRSDNGGDSCVFDSECGENLYCQEQKCTAWTPSDNPAVTGEFTPPLWFGADPTKDNPDDGIFGMHSVLLRSGKVLLFAGHGFTNSLYKEESIIWDPDTETSSRQSFDEDIFCSHHAVMPSGDVLITGGGALPDFFLAKRKTWRFDVLEERWKDAGAMAFERWYPTLINLPDGRIMAASGQAEPIPLEIFDPEARDSNGSYKNEWTVVENSYRNLPELYPAMRLLPNGTIFNPAVGWDAANGASLLTLGKTNTGADTASWTPVARPSTLHEQGDTTFHIDDTTSPPATVMRVYGGGIVDARGLTETLPDGTKPETNDVEEVDLTNPDSGLSWHPLAPMNQIRANVSVVMLPDGKMWAVGGQTGGQWNHEQNGQGYILKHVYDTELYDPVTNQWTITKALIHPRQYHHTATLLPDGRVLVTAGQDPTKAGKLTGGQDRDLRSYEVYSPPYLFNEDGTKAVQPALANVPEVVGYDQDFDVDVDVVDGRSISKLILLSPTSETHHTDNGRYVTLKFSKTASGARVTSPSTNSVAPPGYYMLFAIDSEGVPSIGSFIKVTN